VERKDQPEYPCGSCKEIAYADPKTGRTVYWHELQGLGMGQDGGLDPGTTACLPGGQAGYTSPWQRRSMTQQAGRGFYPYQSQTMMGMPPQGNFGCQPQMGWGQFCEAGRLSYDLDQSFYAIESGASPEQVFYELDRRNVSGRMGRHATPSMNDLLDDWLNMLKGAGTNLATGLLYSTTAPFVRMGYSLSHQARYMGQSLGSGMNYMRFNRPGFCGQQSYPSNRQYMCGDPYSGHRY
jgi:hypothetical protein